MASPICSADVKVSGARPALDGLEGYLVARGRCDSYLLPAPMLTINLACGPAVQFEIIWARTRKEEKKITLEWLPA